MAEAARRCVFKALAMGEEEVVKSMDLSFFDWCSTHPDFGTPLHAILFGKISYEEKEDEEEIDKEMEDKYRVHEFTDIVSADEANRKSRLELVRFAIQNGGDPHSVAPKECNASRLWGDDSNMKRVEFAGESSLECLLATKRFIKTIDELRDEDDAEWTEELATVEEALKILAGANPSVGSAVAVPEGVAATWESVLADVETMDVTIRVGCDGTPRPSAIGNGSSSSSETPEIRAHSVVLRGASEVLKAMLSTQYREGASKEIEVRDCCLEGVRLLIGLIYTGMVDSTDGRPIVSTMLAALDLAHRWQLLHLVPLLSAAVGKHLDDQSFESAVDLALRLQLPGLLTACRAYAANHKRELRARLAKRSDGFHSDAVRAEVERMIGGGPNGTALEAPPKRRRLPL
jgi:hypothetical protein